MEPVRTWIVLGAFMGLRAAEVAGIRAEDITEERFADKVVALPGFKPSIPMVFCSLFPIDSSEFEKLREELSLTKDVYKIPVKKRSAKK